MSKLFIPFLALLLIACLSEKNLEPADELTFTRFFSDGYEDNPIQVEETPDNGFIILANTNIKNSDADLERDRIMLIKTDSYGHQEWIRYFPDNIAHPPADVALNKRWNGLALTILKSGDYLITGAELQGQTSLESAPRQVLILKVDQAGDLISSNVASSSFSVTGTAIVEAPSKNTPAVDNYFVLAHSEDASVTNNIFLAEISNTLTDTLWERSYAGGKVSLTNRLIYKGGAAPYLYWAGEREVSASISTLFITQVLLDAAGTENGLAEIRTPQAIDHLLDFAPKGEVFGLTGFTEGAQLGNIIFSLANSYGAGNPDDFMEYKEEIFDDPGALRQDSLSNVKEEKGNSITATNDGGFMILGQIDTYTGVLGEGNTDLFMLKINGLGGRQWTRHYGNIDIDAGVCVRQASDGGYIVLGHTRLAALRSILLIKTDKEGLVR